MIDLAYDGSVHADWVARYALNVAARATPPGLRILHVREPGEAIARVREKLEALVEEGADHGLDVEVVEAPREGPVDRTLARLAGDDRDRVLLCGSRMQPGPRGFLAGTVAQRLLARPPCHVVTIRVVQPGLLGAPQRILLPVAGHPRLLRAAAPLLGLLAPDIRRSHVLRVMQVSRVGQRRLDPSREDRLRRSGRAYVERVEAELCAITGLPAEAVDGFVRISSDWTREVLVHAAHYGIDLIALGATERNLAARVRFRNPLERVLRHAPCDVAIHRSAD